LKPQEQKAEFIRLRAEGRSYSYIADTLHISKSTCTAWEREKKALEALEAVESTAPGSKNRFSKRFGGSGGGHRQ